MDSPSKWPPTHVPGDEQVLSRFRHGIWNVAQDKSSVGWCHFMSTYFQELGQIINPASKATQLFMEVYDVAPGVVSSYLFLSVWRAVSKAVNLHLFAFLLIIVLLSPNQPCPIVKLICYYQIEQGLSRGNLDRNSLRLIMYVWIINNCLGSVVVFIVYVGCIILFLFLHIVPEGMSNQNSELALENIVFLGLSRVRSRSHIFSNA